jgi:hypothetical protein
MTQQPAFQAQYISKCGLETCPYCKGANGYQGKTWPMRLCQYGAQDMALAGSNYRTILQHYYGNITFSDETSIPPEGDTMDSVIVCDLTDAKKYGVTILPAQVAPGQGYWQVQSFKNLTANDGRHNFYADVLKDGLRVYGTQIKATWPPGGPGPAYFNIEKPASEPGGNMAINKHDFLAFAIQGAAPCEVISGVNTQFNGDPSTGSSLYHYSFMGVWVWKVNEVTPPPPPDEMDEFTQQDHDDLAAAIRYYDGIQEDLASLKDKLDAISSRHP